MPIEDIVVTIKANVKEFIGSITMTQKVFKQLEDGTGRINKNLTKNVSIMGKMGLAARKAMLGFRGFKMEMLSVMFFGLGMKRFFTGLIRPALEMVGVFDVLRAALQILFLPVALKVLDWALKFLNWVTNMSPGMQKWVNVVAAAGVILGQLLFIIGSVTLGLGGLLLFVGGIIGSFINFGAILLELLPGWAQFSAAIFAFSFAPELMEKFKNVMVKVKDSVKGLLDKFVQLEFVQDLLKDLGLEGETFSAVWGNIKDVLVNKLGDLGEEFKWWFKIKLPLYFMLAKASVRAFVKDLTIEFNKLEPVIELAERLNNAIVSIAGFLGRTGVRNPPSVSAGVNTDFTNLIAQVSGKPTVTINQTVNANSDFDFNRALDALDEKLTDRLNQITRS